MLILTRKTNESVIIGDDIMIKVLDSRTGQLRIGIIAPRKIPVHRQEIYERIHGKLPAVLEEIYENDDGGNV